MKKEEFKEFVKKNPKLITYVNNNEMTWQKFYEMYDLYGESNEVWKDIEGYEGLYQVSNLGRVKATARVVINKNGEEQFFNEKILKPYVRSDKYLQTTLCRNNKIKKYCIQRLVAQAFPDICGEWFEGCQVNHLNECKWDNRAINLRTCTAKENSNWGTRNVRISKRLSKPVAQYTLDGILIATYTGFHDIEKQKGFAVGNIWKCCVGKYRTAYGYIWKYKNPE